MAVKAKPEGYHTVTPFLHVKGIPKLIEFVEKGLGGKELSRQPSPDGAIMHAEVKIGDSIIMMSEKNEQHSAMPAMLYVYVDDVDATYKQALAAGATKQVEPADQFYGDRSGCVIDPSGNVWWISKHIEDVSNEELQKRIEQQEPQPA